MRRACDHHRQRLVVGVLVILVGFVALLDNLHLVEGAWIRGLWPLVLVAAGVMRLQQVPPSDGAKVVGATLIIVGAAWTMSNFGWMHFSMHTWWPMLVIAAGLWVIARGAQRSRREADDGTGAADPSVVASASGLPPSAGLGGATGRGATGSADSHAARVDSTVVFGGSVVRNDSPDFQGGEITVALGGLELDLRQAAMTRDEVKIDVFVLLGGLVLRVPPDWSVVLKASPVLGGMEDKSAPPPGATRRLVIDGVVLMGGLEVKR